jgi:integrase
MSLNDMKLIEKYQRFSQNEATQQLLKNPLIQKDTWHTVDDLNLEISEHKRNLTINFNDISLDWLKLLSKLYILIRIKSIKNANTHVVNVNRLKKFSYFLELNSLLTPEQIDENIFEDFEQYVYSIGGKYNTVRNSLSVLCNFFDTSRKEGWLNINTYWFQGKWKRINYYPHNDEIEYIPEEVWNQLDRNLYHLPEPLQRMVLVIRTLGLRIGEICNMPFDCLRKRGKSWHIRFRTEKYDIEDELPIISTELVAIIKEQQVYIRDNLGEEYNKLFCANRQGAGRLGNPPKTTSKYSPTPKVMLSSSFNLWLNKLAKACDICTKEGNVWQFKSHQFRRTVATVMANAGIRDLIIMKYLRHRSIDMQRHYIHLLQQVLGDEIEELMQEKKYVDITGKAVAFYKPKNPVTELLRRRMYQITTQYGECHRPELKSPCQTVNACWQCQEWRTSSDDLPYLKDDLKRLEEELEIAKRTGMVRQQQGLEGDRDSLLKCIQGLEVIND